MPTHSHPNEQVTYIVEGALKFLIQGKEIVVAAGEALCIPAKIPHSAEALQDTLNIDVFHPNAPIGTTKATIICVGKNNFVSPERHPAELSAIFFRTN